MESDQKKSKGEQSSAADANHRIEPGLKQTAVTATISFVFGVGALLSLVFVHPAMILSLPAIAFGHIAKVTLGKANGELVGWGKARIGKLLGYLCLLVSVLLFLNLDDYRLLWRGVKNSERTAVVKPGDNFSAGRLGEVERELASGEANEFGNNETAEKLAAAFRGELRQALNSVLTHRENKGLGLDTSGIGCYCHDADSGILFIAVVPELNQYNGAAEDVLRKSAWQSAVVALRENGLEGINMDGKLLVGFMETAKCETVLAGTLNSQSNGAPSPDSVELDGSQLADMFKE